MSLPLVHDPSECLAVYRTAHTMIDVESVSFILLRCPIAVNGLDKSLYTGTAQTLHILIVPYLIIIYGDTVDNRNRGRSLHLIHS